MLKHCVGIDTSRVCDKANNGRQALNMVVANAKKNKYEMCDYDLILMDCDMPFMDGYEATQKIRQFLYEQSIDQPIITAWTGQTETTNVKKSFLCGMNQVLSKPLPIDVIRQLVSMLGYPIKKKPKREDSNISKMKMFKLSDEEFE